MLENVKLNDLSNDIVEAIIAFATIFDSTDDFYVIDVAAESFKEAFYTHPDYMTLEERLGW